MKWTILILIYSSSVMSQASFTRSQTNQDRGSSYSAGPSYEREYAPHYPSNQYDNSYGHNPDFNRGGSGQQRERAPSEDFAHESLAAALELLENTRLTGADQAVVERMRAKAREAVLVFSHSRCRPTWAAFVSGSKDVNGRKEINVCEGFFVTPRLDYGQFLMLHELAHLGGIHDECRADEMARKILTANDENITPSGYDSRCL
jgi:hypothetical protein